MEVEMKNGIVVRMYTSNPKNVVPTEAVVSSVGSSAFALPKVKKVKTNGKKKAEGEKKVVKKKGAVKKVKKEEKKVQAFHASAEEMKELHEKAKMDMNMFGFGGLKRHLE